MVVVSHLFLFLRKSFRGRFDSCESNLPLFGTIYFPTAPSCYNEINGEEKDGRKKLLEITAFFIVL